MTPTPASADSPPINSDASQPQATPPPTAIEVHIVPDSPEAAAAEMAPPTPPFIAPNPVAQPPPPPPPPAPAADAAPPPPPVSAEAAAAEVPNLTVLSGLPSAVHPLRLGELVIGRSAEADLQLKHPEISRRHCRLAWDGQHGSIEDLASRWGTKVNNAALASNTRTPLAPGDRIQLGPVLIHYGFGPPPLAVQAAASAAAVVAGGGVSGGGGPPPLPVPPPDIVIGPAAVAVGGSSASRNSRVLFRGQPVDRLPLAGITRVTFGRNDENEVVLADPSISRKHASVERVADGFLVKDLFSRAGSLANGRRFEQHRLVIGDQLQMGPFFFRFDGQALERTSGLAGIEIEAQHVVKRVGEPNAFQKIGAALGLRESTGPNTILDDVSVKIDRGQFVAILGPSGSGKSSLLDTLTGLRPGQMGRILFDGADFYQFYDQLRSLIGYVPQDDIVHTELTVQQALLFSAKLRLPRGTPQMEIAKLVTQTIARLGLDGGGDPRRNRTHTPIARLSGGQRKRVSVGVELLARPAVLFLDEPTSGLDPAAEFKMMELLRHLADGGCTVICTTHVMENVYLTDRLFVIASGALVFGGNVQEAREHFGVPKINMLYDRLEEYPATYWRTRFLEAAAASGLVLPPPLLPNDVGATAGPGAPPLPPTGATSTTTRIPRFKSQPRKANLVTLLRRQWAILCADWKNFLILFGQPLVIALLVAWVASEPEITFLTPTSLALFFTYLATLWFGCSNAAQEIVRELPIYRRERMVGLGRHTYLLSKFLLLGSTTAAQGGFLYVCLLLVMGKTLVGSIGWQVGSLLCTALAGVGIGFAISAFAKTTMQAVMIVPLVLIPQILFSGFVVPPDQMNNAVWWPTQAAPSFAAQTMMDESIFWNRTIDADVVSKYRAAFRNLEIQLDRRRKLPDGGMNDEVPKVIKFRDTYRYPLPGALAALKLICWGLLGYALTWFALRTKERG
ncbi:MAG: FHA domain-containing protein [Verrucomicrobia bacterium]|nr:FHA domain-containing protein [Verrucomicrobiota bacterium]